MYLLYIFQDITADLTLTDIEKEISPRISARDLTDLIRNTPDRLMVIDIRSSVDYSRVRLPQSVNVPFGNVQVSEPSLDHLNLEPALREILMEDSRIVVCVSNQHEEAVAVGFVTIFKVVLL